MKLFPLKLPLNVSLFISCKKAPDPVERNEFLVGTWEESFTWFTYEDRAAIDDDYSMYEIRQHSVLSLEGDRFNVNDRSQFGTIVHTC